MTTTILGAGVTGVAASWASGHPAFEAEACPGGICRSYLEGGYRFEIGGGHWVFGGDPMLNAFLDRWTKWRRYQRRSAVYFPETGRRAPYPLQYNLYALERETARTAAAEMRKPAANPPKTMAEWLEATFGPTLTSLFFGPFHELYTAGLWREIAPQDEFKSPLDLGAVERGMTSPSPDGGYNATFLYPESGLHDFIDAVARESQIRCGHRAIRLDVEARQVLFSNGATRNYDWLLCTLPLDAALTLSGVGPNEEPWPSTSVLVLNLGGQRGPRCPDDHWIYLPRTNNGFHRVGFYSNVDSSFLPASGSDRVSLYVERAFRKGGRPDETSTASYARSVVDELKDWGFLRNAEVISPTWVETAYTWARPGSQWREQSMRRLAEARVLMTGRYGKWRFQGIADSVRDGLLAGSALRPR